MGALEPQLCQRGEVLLTDDFEDLGAVPARWFFREYWTVANGVMTRTGVPGVNQRVFVKKPRYGTASSSSRWHLKERRKSGS